MRNPLAPLYARTMIAPRREARALRADGDGDGEATAGDGARREERDRDAERRRRAPSDRNRRGTPSEHFFLYVGNDKPHKNVDTLIEAFARVPDAQLVLAGAPFERFRGRERVDVRGFVSDDELSSLYRNAIALVMPSLEEGFGLPAAEAMAHGTAVITSNAPALVEVTGDAALHVDARDADALAACDDARRARC